MAVSSPRHRRDCCPPVGGGVVARSGGLKCPPPPRSLTANRVAEWQSQANRQRQLPSRTTLAASSVAVWVAMSGGFKLTARAAPSRTITAARSVAAWSSARHRQDRCPPVGWRVFVSLSSFMAPAPAAPRRSWSASSPLRTRSRQSVEVLELVIGFPFQGTTARRSPHRRNARRQVQV
jgi:hypothetical protein